MKENAVPSPDGFECVKCNAPCSTCINTPDYCTACVEGFEFMGWKCAQTFRFTVGMTLAVDLAYFEANYILMIESLAGAMGITDTNAITVEGIREGSVIADISAAPTGAPGSAEASQQLSMLNNLLKSGNIAGMKVAELSITVDGTSEPLAQLPSEEESKTNVLAIVLGICIPIGVLSNYFFNFSHHRYHCVRDLQEEGC